MLHYILQILAFQLLFLIVYDFFLKKETFFIWNRLYLLITPLLSLLLPLVKVPIIQQNIPSEYMIQLPAVLIGLGEGATLVEANSAATLEISNSGFQIWTLLMAIWYLGMFVGLVIFVRKLLKIHRFKRAGIRKTIDGMRIVLLPKSDVAFSFFNTIFLGENINERQQHTILQHENIHVKERHSLDLLFFEIMRIVCWFNPLVYVFQNKMMLLQEYTADAKVVATKDKKAYYQELLEQVFHTEKISFINTFFNHSLIKKRILMLQKSKSSRIQQLKYLMLIPVVGIMLVYTSCTQEASAQNTFTKSNETPLIAKINELKEQIAIQGHVSDEEMKELKVLIALIKPGSLQDPYFDEVVDQMDIPYSIIEKVPTFKECANLTDNDKRRDCTSSKISAIVNKNFDVKKAEQFKVEGVNRIFVKFKINSKGNVVNVKARASNPGLIKIAEEAVRKIPQMIPGQQDGKNVSVLYSLPITFKLKG